MKFIRKLQEGEDVKGFIIGYKVSYWTQYMYDHAYRDPSGKLLTIVLNFNRLIVQFKFSWKYKNKSEGSRFSNIIHKIRSSKLVRWISRLRAKNNEDGEPSV